jgi:Protein of unknown function (DUF3046)
VRLSQFNELMVDEFGQEQTNYLLQDLVLGELADRTGNQALADGEDPREIWLAICRANGVPKGRWHGQLKKNKKTN